MMNVAQAINVLEKLFAKILPEQQVFLAREMSKIAPAEPNTKVTWQKRLYATTDGTLSVGAYLHVCPAKQYEGETTLSSVLSFFMANTNSLESFAEQMEVVVELFMEHATTPFDLHTSPAVYLSDKVGVMTFSINAATTEDAFKQIERQFESLKPKQ